MAYTEHTIKRMSVVPVAEVECSCDLVFSRSNYAQHVANSIVQGLTERCARAEVLLGGEAHDAERKAHVYQRVQSKLDHTREAGRKSGKKAGVALARSYIEEVIR